MSDHFEFTLSFKGTTEQFNGIRQVMGGFAGVSQQAAYDLGEASEGDEVQVIEPEHGFDANLFLPPALPEANFAPPIEPRESREHLYQAFENWYPPRPESRAESSPTIEARAVRLEDDLIPPGRTVMERGSGRNEEEESEISAGLQPTIVLPTEGTELVPPRAAATRRDLLLLGMQVGSAALITILVITLYLIFAKGSPSDTAPVKPRPTATPSTTNAIKGGPKKPTPIAPPPEVPPSAEAL